MTKTTPPQTQPQIFAPMGLTHVHDIVKPSPTEGPYDWGADSFVFLPDATMARQAL